MYHTHTLLVSFGLLFVSGVLIFGSLFNYFRRTEKTKSDARRLIPRLFRPGEELAGRELRDRIERNGVPISYGLFYLLMSELAREGVVSFRDATEDFEGELLRNRYFKLR